MDLVWQEKYNTDIPEMDNQHQTLFKIMEKLNDDDSKDDKGLLKELYKYAIYHYKSEVELLNANSYPNIENLIAFYQESLDQLFIDIGMYMAGCLFKEDVLYSLERWFLKHTTILKNEFIKYVL
ncbi:hypothetical protein [Oceanispirochaeta sp.]|uniref:bacteriohemerythrin n=1 Tax=Oceanispirochaeta sp. TaxID=2035350 RepID=UPI002626321E|nr:hypothetical protein [Oceanispirochaeta sp.]MDA3956746.1 hypothetical protein [Oceanispirochaeta sp.]